MTIINVNKTSLTDSNMSQPKLRINIGNDNLKSSEISQSSNKSVKSSKYHSTDRATKYKDIKRNKMINYHPMKN